MKRTPLQPISTGLVPSCLGLVLQPVARGNILLVEGRKDPIKYQQILESNNTLSVKHSWGWKGDGFIRNSLIANTDISLCCIYNSLGLFLHLSPQLQIAIHLWSLSALFKSRRHLIQCTPIFLVSGKNSYWYIEIWKKKIDKPQFTHYLWNCWR